MWNDTDTPLAYLITFRTYGTWLHGDERGSTNRFRNKYGSAFLPKETSWIETNRSRMKSTAVILDAEMRDIVEASIRETCSLRNWALLAVNVRTNHVHIVASVGSTSAGMALNAFKANATRKLRETGLVGDKSPWADKGSQRYLWNAQHVKGAVDYVLLGQGDELPKFE